MIIKKLTLAGLIVSLLGGLAPIPSIAQPKTKKIKISGYITNVISPTAFEIDDYRVTKDESIILEFENQSPEVQFKPEDIRVGTEIEVQGLLNEETDELKATKLKIDLEQFRKLKNTTVLTRDASGIEKMESGWEGILWADGRRIRIDGKTDVRFELNKSERKAAEQASKGKKDQEPDDEFANSEPLKAVTDVKAGMFATYEGLEQPDGTVLASRIVFWKGEMEKGEEKLWKSFKMQEKAPNFAEANPGELKIAQVGKFKLLPNKEVQEYVQRIGESLIPAYQKALPADDPQKIPFKFFVISDKDANAFALANGTIVINSGMMTLLENEAQLAAVIAHEISHSTQEHTWRQLNKDKGKRTALMIGGIAAAAFGLYGVTDIIQLTLAAMTNGYNRRLENQADRIGLEYMVASGYDPREAPRVWKLMAKKHGNAPTNFFWSSHENNARRRSFLMIEIRNNYSDLNFNDLKRGDESEYEQIAALAREAASKKKKVKIKAV